MDTQSTIDTYKYACGDLEKQFACIVEQSLWFYLILLAAFIVVACTVGVIFYLSIQRWGRR